MKKDFEKNDTAVLALMLTGTLTSFALVQSMFKSKLLTAMVIISLSFVGGFFWFLSTVKGRWTEY